MCLTSTKRIIRWIDATRFEFTMFNERWTRLNKKDLLRSSSSSSFERYNLNCRVSIISSIKSYYFSITVVPNNFSNKLIFTTVSRFYCYTSAVDIFYRCTPLMYKHRANKTKHVKVLFTGFFLNMYS